MMNVSIETANTTVNITVTCLDDVIDYMIDNNIDLCEADAWVETPAGWVDIRDMY